MPGDDYYDGCYYPPTRPIQRPGEADALYASRVDAFNIVMAPLEAVIAEQEQERYEARVDHIKSILVVPLAVVVIALVVGIIYICWPLISLFLLGWVFKDTFFDGGLHPNPWVSTRLRRQNDWLWGARGRLFSRRNFGHTSDGAGTGDGI